MLYQRNTSIWRLALCLLVFDTLRNLMEPSALVLGIQPKRHLYSDVATFGTSLTNSNICGGNQTFFLNGPLSSRWQLMSIILLFKPKWISIKKYKIVHLLSSVSPQASIINRNISNCFEHFFHSSTPMENFQSYENMHKESKSINRWQ